MVGKKVIFSLLSVLFIFLISCDKKAEKETALWPYVHRKAGYVWLSKEKPMPAGFFLQKFLSPPQRKTIDSLPGKEVIINFLFQPDQTIHFLGVKSLSSRTKQTSGQNPNGIFVTTKDNLLFFADDRQLLDDFTSSLPGSLIPRSRAEKYYQTLNAEAPAHWYIFPGNIPSSQAYAFSHNWLFKKTGDVHIWDVESPGLPVYTGVSLSADTLNRFVDIFEGIEPSGNEPAFYLPSFTQTFVELKFNSFPVFSRQWKEYKTTLGYRSTENLSSYKSLKSIVFVSRPFPFVTGIFSSLPQTLIDKSEKTEAYKQYAIFLTPDSTMLSRFFFPLSHKKSYPYMVINENTIVWTVNLQNARQIIDAWTGDNVLVSEKKFLNLSRPAGNNNHLLYFDKNELFFAQAGENMLMTGLIKNAGEKISVPEFKSKPVKTRKNRQKPADVSYKTYLTQNLPGNFLYPPHWIYNHRTRKHEIIYQDTVKRLTLVNALGKTHWTKALSGEINGEIHQVDMFRNGKRQFVFATGEELILLDILGHFVPPFPIRVKSAGPIAVFDYDRNHNYRIAVPLKNKLKLYNLKGEIVSGFQSPELTDALQHAPQHIRIKTKDYILLQQRDGTLHILNRKGKPRLKIKRKIRLKTGRWFLYKNIFTALTNDGKIIHINTRGNISFSQKNQYFTEAFFTPKHSMFATGKTLFIDGSPVAEGTFSGLKIFIFAGKPVYYAYNTAEETAYLFITSGQKFRIRSFPGFKLLDLLKKHGQYYAIMQEGTNSWKVISFQ